jgi:hypothetical protein
MMGAEFVALSLGISENLHEQRESISVMVDVEVTIITFCREDCGNQ